MAGFTVNKSDQALYLEEVLTEVMDGRSLLDWLQYADLHGDSHVTALAKGVSGLGTFIPNLLPAAEEEAQAEGFSDKLAQLMTWLQSDEAKALIPLLYSIFKRVTAAKPVPAVGGVA